jgi:hypothetical protein
VEPSRIAFAVSHSESEEAAVFAIIAAVIFGLALILDLADATLGTVDGGTLLVAGLLCVSLHLAGIGANTRKGIRLRRRR